MSARILDAEEIAAIRERAVLAHSDRARTSTEAIIDSHERLRAERDAAVRERDEARGLTECDRDLIGKLGKHLENEHGRALAAEAALAEAREVLRQCVDALMSTEIAKPDTGHAQVQWAEAIARAENDVLRTPSPTRGALIMAVVEAVRSDPNTQGKVAAALRALDGK